MGDFLDDICLALGDESMDDSASEIVSKNSEEIEFNLNPIEDTYGYQFMTLIQFKRDIYGSNDTLPPTTSENYKNLFHSMLDAIAEAYTSEEYELFCAETRIEEEKETNADYSIPELPKEIREQLEGIASSFSLLERISFCGFKFSFSDKCDNYYRLLRFFHTLSGFFRRPNVLLKMPNTYFFRNKDNHWKLMFKSPFNFGATNEVFKALMYEKNLEDKFIFTYRDFFYPDKVNDLEFTHMLIEKFKYKLKERNSWPSRYKKNRKQLVQQIYNEYNDDFKPQKSRVTRELRKYYDIPLNTDSRNIRRLLYRSAGIEKEEL